MTKYSSWKATLLVARVTTDPASWQTAVMNGPRKFLNTANYEEGHTENVLTTSKIGVELAYRSWTTLHETEPNGTRRRTPTSAEPQVVVDDDDDEDDDEGYSSTTSTGQIC